MDFRERIFGVGAIGALLAAAEEADEESDYGERESLLEDMEIQLDQWNAQVPDDPDSAAYERWECSCEELEQRIDALAKEIYG